MDIWGTLKGALKGTVPLLANAIIPGSGGLAATLLSKVTGADPENPQAMLEAVQSMSPDQWAELKRAEMDHKADLARISADLDKAYLADRQGARDRDTKLQLAGHHNYRADIMLALAFCSLLAIVWMVWNKADEMPTHVFALFNMSAGMLLKMISDAFQFEFGSSRGSKEKDAAIAKGKA